MNVATGKGLGEGGREVGCGCGRGRLLPYGRDAMPGSFSRASGSSRWCLSHGCWLSRIFLSPRNETLMAPRLMHIARKIDKDTGKDRYTNKQTGSHYRLTGNIRQVLDVVHNTYIIATYWEL